MIRRTYPKDNPWHHLTVFDLVATGEELKKLYDYAVESDPDDWRPGRQGSGYFKQDLKNLVTVTMPGEDRKWIRKLHDSMISEIHYSATGSYTYAHSDWGRLSDCWLIYYPEGSYIPWHTDPVPKGTTMYRMNLVVTSPRKGGDLSVPNGWQKSEPLTVNFEPGQAVLFKPSEIKHSITPVGTGGRLVLSVGRLYDAKGDVVDPQ